MTMDEPSESDCYVSDYIWCRFCDSYARVFHFAIGTGSPKMTQYDDSLAGYVSICGHHLVLIVIKTCCKDSFHTLETAEVPEAPKSNWRGRCLQ